MKKIAAVVMAGAFVFYCAAACFAQGEDTERGAAGPQNNGGDPYGIGRDTGNGNGGKDAPPAPDAGRSPDQGGNRGDRGPAGPGTGTTGDQEKDPMQNQGPIIPNPQR